MNMGVVVRQLTQAHLLRQQLIAAFVVGPRDERHIVQMVEAIFDSGIVISVCRAF